MSPDKHYDIDTLLEEVVTLPSMPDTVSRILSMLDRQEHSLAQVAEVIALDPSITMKILRLVNSAFYGLGAQVNTVTHAAALLGAKVVRNLVMSATVFNSLQGYPESFIKHCIATGIAMRALEETGPTKGLVGSPDEAFVVGLIHDIGKTLIATYLPEEAAEVQRLSAERQLSAVQAEQEIMGIDHAEMGFALARHWKLNPRLADSIAGHHDLARCAEANRPLAAMLGVANYIANTSGLAVHPKLQPQIDDAYWEIAGIKSQTVAQTVYRFLELVPELPGMLDIS